MLLRPDARLIALVAAALAVSGAVRADQASPQQPTFRANVNVIELDVSVLDKDGRPVKGLTTRDFTVLEDGQPQKVVAFGAVEVADAAASTATRAAEWTRRVSPDVVTNQLDDKRLVLIVMDDATLIQQCDPPWNSLCPERPPCPPGGGPCDERGGRGGRAVGGRGGGAAPPDVSAEERAREAAHLVIEQLGANDLASVTFTDLGTPPLDFTKDHAKLDQAVERFSTRFQPSCLTFQRAIRTLKATADYMASVQNRRKALIYIGGGIPVDFTTQQMKVALDDDNGACAWTLIDTMKDVFISAERSNVAMYTIDPFGLRAWALPGTGAGAEIDSQKILASNTGGRAIVDTNDFKPGIQQIFRENSSYYMVGYEPANTKEDGTIRRIDVKVDRPGVDVRTRRTYIAPDARKIAAAAAAPPPPASVNAIESVLPKADVPLTLAVAPFAAPGGKATVKVVLGVDEPMQSTPRPDDLDVSVAALDPFGAVKETWRQTVHADPVGFAGTIAHYEVQSQVNVSPGRFQVLVGAASTALGKDGSVYTDVEVPNFSRASLSLSGVVLNAGPTATSQRSFSRTDDLSAFFQVYEGGQAALKPVNLQTRLVDDRDREVTRTAETIAVGAFDAVQRAADHHIAIPLSTLAPGRYLLTVEATDGRTTVERDVVLSVR